MNKEISQYIAAQTEDDQVICEQLQALMTAYLPNAENKLWHGHPVWFLEGNPIVGYSKLNAGIRLMFWSGADFGEPKLTLGSGKFKDASITYQLANQIDVVDVHRWLEKSKTIQWDYKNIVKRRGKLERLQP